MGLWKETVTRNEKINKLITLDRKVTIMLKSVVNFFTLAQLLLTFLELINLEFILYYVIIQYIIIRLLLQSFIKSQSVTLKCLVLSDQSKINPPRCKAQKCYLLYVKKKQQIAET